MEASPFHLPSILAYDVGATSRIRGSLASHSPLQMLMIDWVGSEGGRFYIHHARYREQVDALYEAVVTSYAVMYAIAAQSPAAVVMFGDNVDGVLVNPRLFQHYFLPPYEECAAVVHDQGNSWPFTWMDD